MRFAERPVLVFWELTRRCPLACVHCRARAGPEPLPGELATDEAERLLEALTAFGSPLPVLVLTGGDPLSRPDLFDLIASARGRGLPVAVSPAVSDRLTAEVLERFASEGVASVSFSLDGATAATHDGVRGVPGTFAATLAAIAAARRAGLRVQVNTTVLRSNLAELPRLCGLLLEHGVPTWEVFFLVRTGRGAELEELSPEEYEAVGHLLYDATGYGLVVRPIEGPFVRRIAAERRAAPDRPTPAAFSRWSDELRSRLGPPSRAPSISPTGTLDGDGTVFVAHDGTIYPGGFVEVPLGNVRVRSPVAVYRDEPRLRSIRARAFHGPCGRCDHRAVCGGSRARSWAISGDLLGSDPACLRVAGTARPPVGEGPGPGGLSSLGASDH